MNKDLFLAILSMDSYNRGYGQALLNMPTVVGGTKIGNATIASQDITDTAQATGLR